MQVVVWPSVICFIIQLQGLPDIDVSEFPGVKELAKIQPLLWQMFENQLCVNT